MVRIIIRTLCAKYINTKQIADSVRINWNTAQKHLIKLRVYGYIIGKEVGDSIY